MMELMRLVLYLLVYTVFVFDVRVSSLRLVELRIPSHSVHNTMARLECRYELDDGEFLYSLKWYKDGNEFFRYVPRDNPPTQVFDLPGVIVDLDNSTNISIVLGPMELTSSGRYRCEVSGEAPLFQTVSDHGDMAVVALPELGPVISGSRPRYQIGDVVKVNCTSGQSKPAAKLSWFINGEPANVALLKGPYIMETESEMEITSLGLEFKVRPKHFRKGDLKLKCLATIATVYWKSNEESVQGERQKSYTKTREVASTSNSRADRVQASSVSKGISSAPWLFHSPSYLWILSLLVILHGS